MNFTYDLYNRTEPSKIYLARPDKQLICALNGVDEASVSLTLNLNNAHELSFDVNRYVDGVESAGYDMLERFMNVYVTGIGWFKIQHPETSFDGQKEVRHVTAESLEIELQQYDLVGFKVNCGTEDSVEMMAEGNVYEENGVQKLHDVVRLYNPDNPKLSFLHLVLEDVPGWSVGYVDDYIDTSGEEPVLFKDKSVKFDVDNQDVYSFLCQEAAGAFHCIFLFDTESCTVNAYPPETLGEDTNIFLGFRNLQNSVEVSVDADSIYTVFHVAGDNDLNINYVNFGSSYIEDLSYFLSPSFMSQALIDKYTAWRDYVEEKRPAYIEASKAYNAQLEIVTDLYERLPNDGCGTDWSTFSDKELAKAKENYLAQQAGYESLYVDEDKAFDYEALKASVDFHDYDMIVRIILPNIEIELANRGKDKELDPDDYLDSWETEWELYGLHELEAKLKGYQDTIKTLKENGFDVVYSKENSLYTENYHNEMHEAYVEAVKNYNDCSAAIGSDEDGRESGRKGEIKAAEAILEGHNTVRRELEKDVAKENERFGFTAGDFLILGKLYNATDYVNNNLFTTSLDTTVTAVDKQLALLKEAKEQLSSESQPQFTYSTSQDNLFALPEYRELHHKLQLGNFIRVSLRDDYEVKLRVISIGFHPLVLDNNLDIGFSNMIMSNSKRNDFASILDRSAKSSKNQISIGSGGNTETPISDNLLRALLSSPGFGNMATNIAAKSVRAIVGDFDALTADLIKTGQLEAEVAKIKDLDAESAFAKYLRGNYLSSDKFLTDDMTACTGTFTDWLTGVNIHANNITGGTLSVNRLEIRGSTDSIVYALNNISGTLEATHVNTIDGNVLTPRTIEADRMVADSITAHELKTGTITAESGIISDLTADVIKTGTLDASKVTVKNLDAESIVSGTIDASILDVVHLNADNITSGSISGAEICLGDGAFVVDINGNSFQKNTVISGGLNIKGEAIVNELTGIVRKPISASLISNGDGKICIIHADNLFLSLDSGATWRYSKIPPVRLGISSQHLQYDKASGCFVLFENNFKLIIPTDISKLGSYNTVQYNYMELNISRVCCHNGKHYALANYNNLLSLDNITSTEFWNNEGSLSMYDIASDGSMLYLLSDNSTITCCPYYIGPDCYNISAPIPNPQFIVYTNSTMGLFLLSPDGACTFTQAFSLFNYEGVMDTYTFVDDNLTPAGNFISLKYINELNALCAVRYDAVHFISYIYYSGNLDMIPSKSTTGTPLFTCSLALNFKVNEICYSDSFFILGENGNLVTLKTLNDSYQSIRIATDKLNAAIYNNSKFIVVGNNGYIVNIALTGIANYEWRSYPYDTSNDLHDIIYFKDDYYFCGGHTIYSLNQSQSWDMDFSVYSLCNYNGSIFAVGEKGCAALMVPTGNSFNITPIFLELDTILRSVTTNNHILIAVGDNGTIIEYQIVNDSISYNVMKSGTAQKLNSIVYGKNIFTAVGETGSIFTMKPSDRLWIRRHTSTIHNLNKVSLNHNAQYDSGYFIAVGDNGTVLYSINGYDWVKQTQNCEDNLITTVNPEGNDLIIADNGTLYTTRYINQKVSTNITIDRGGFYYSVTQSGTTNETYNLIYPVFDDPHLAIPKLECDHIGHQANEGIYFELDADNPSDETVRIASPAMFDEGVYTNSLYDRSNPGRDLMPWLKNLIVETDVFKPIVYGGTTAGNCTYTTSKCAYYRVGRLVFINIYVVITKKGTSEGGVFIKGLPYKCAVTCPLTVGDTAKQSAAIHVHSATVSSSGYISLWRAGLTNTATANNENATLQFSQIADGFAVQISGCYLTNDPAKN